MTAVSNIDLLKLSNNKMDFGDSKTTYSRLEPCPIQKKEVLNQIFFYNYMLPWNNLLQWF